MNAAWRHCLGPALLIAIAAPVCAQSGAERSEILRFRDSLSAVRDTNALRTLETALLDVARADRNQPFPKLRLGYTGLRLAQVTGSAAHFRDAESEFQWVTELQPRWPLGWYALGRAEFLEADVFPPALRAIFGAMGRDIFLAAARDIARSAQVDSSFVYGLVELANDALAYRVRSHLETALAALRIVAPTPAGRVRDVEYLHGMIEREAGDADSAISAFARVIARDSSDAQALFAMSATQMAAGRRAGVGPWYHGLRVAAPDVVAAYRSDLALVMSDSALRAFDSATTGAARVVVARRFWDTRDPDGLNGGADRLKEHYRRIEYSERNFPLAPSISRYDTLPTYALTGSRFDDRGRIYVRHGDPDDRTSLSLVGLPPNETWVYHRPGGDLLFNFAKPDSAAGYRMYESLLDIAGLGTAAQHTGQGDVAARLNNGQPLETFGAGWTAQAVQELLYSRQKLSPIYRRMLSDGIKGARDLQLAERAEGRHSIDVGLQTDSWRLRFELPMTADIDVVAFGRDETSPQLQVAFAISGASLYAPPAPAGTFVVYPIRMRVAVRNAAGEVVAAVDTTRNFVAAAPIALDGRLLGRLPVDVPAGDYTVRVALETESRGAILPAKQVHVAPVGARDLSLTDIALGTRRIPLTLAGAAGDTVWFNPIHRDRASDPLELAFDVGGLRAGNAYKVQLAVLRPGRNQPVLQIGSNATARGTTDRIRRELDITRIGTGDFELMITITTADGKSVSRRHAFTVTR